ncbi:TIGR03943 family putative permease subunit [Streptomyces soliscabiei]|uniref:TIGR03943 family putative permease subunit n=1 Tax=Streptomyces soliscabiei TaxID=588897 RepID=UPI0029AB6F7D|nr:TIGR03943 family protein [Streptomyces sp. NY05-11A]MDX2683196.1 TIGR03943 family protein [Streptomyces sp. NY05-11A]
MRRYGPAVLLLLVGAAVLRISLFSALYLRYVQSGLRPYLIASGALLVLLGMAAGVRAAREVPDEDEDPHDHGSDHTHTTGPRLAWLLALPTAALLVFPPPALGSYSAEREDAQRAAQGVGTFPALPAVDPVDLSVVAFTSRAIYDSGHSLKERTVRLTGFVTHGDDGTWYVTRLLVSCCAADATTSKVRIRGADAPATDTWVTITGTWHPKGGLGSSAAWPPVLDAKTIRQVDQPSDPYEKR